MRIIKINQKKVEPDQIDLIVDYFNRGKTVVYPTDTIYGIGCDATNAKAIKKVRKIKQSDPKKPLLMLVKSFCMLRKYCYLNTGQYRYLHALWPGPFSAILKKRKALPEEITGGGDFVGVRMPKNDFLSAVLKKLDKPIVSTSANISFQKNLSDVSEIENYFKIKPDLVVDAGVCRRKKASRLVDVSDIKNIKLIRR